jgi:hypothetical protein
MLPGISQFVPLNFVRKFPPDVVDFDFNVLQGQAPFESDFFSSVPLL